MDEEGCPASISGLPILYHFTPDSTYSDTQNFLQRAELELLMSDLSYRLRESGKNELAENVERLMLVSSVTVKFLTKNQEEAGDLLAKRKALEEKLLLIGVLQDFFLILEAARDGENIGSGDKKTLDKGLDILRKISEHYQILSRGIHYGEAITEAKKYEKVEKELKEITLYDEESLAKNLSEAFSSSKSLAPSANCNCRRCKRGG